MSLPLTRRIARAALLVAAGAAPVVGAAGSASAMDHGLVPTGTLPGLSTLDGAGLGDAVDSASQTATGVAGDTGGKAVGKAVPAAGKTVGKAGKTAAPAAEKATGGAGEVLGKAAGAATESAEGPAAGMLGGLPLAGGLPLGG
ncbi:ATP-binding protein [Streptomyces sp. NBC_01216]|uniref:ATP-binding protein n=1 Tax=unclassified Streptomyces TaxID=2593676 RepID=UPI002E1459A3|nr:ATP-binding protein [Streptomyces sp. NBC_01216]